MPATVRSARSIRSGGLPSWVRAFLGTAFAAAVALLAVPLFSAPGAGGSGALETEGGAHGAEVAPSGGGGAEGAGGRVGELGAPRGGTSAEGPPSEGDRRVDASGGSAPRATAGQSPRGAELGGAAGDGGEAGIGDAGRAGAGGAAPEAEAALAAAGAAGDTAGGAGGSVEAEPSAVVAEVPAEPPPPPPTVQETRPPSLPQAERPRVALGALLGLLGLLVPAYVANHPRVRRLGDWLGLRSAITAGFPFVALGLLARHPAVGVLTDDVLVALTPLIEFGLGWIGFLVGYHLDLRAIDRLPRGTALVTALDTLVPLLSTGVFSALALIALGYTWHEGVLPRAALVLGISGAMTAPAAIRAVLRSEGVPPAAQYLDEIVGVLGLATLAAYFRPEGLEAAWALPGTAWLFVTLGMGATLGSLLYLILRRPAGRAEFMVVAVGSVAFTAGMAAYVWLSPLVICFVAGLVIANLPSVHRDALGEALEQLARPIFLVLLALAGALWDPSDWRGWALVPVFLASRYLGLAIGRAFALRREPAAATELRPASPLVAPLSIVAIAVVVSVRILYEGPVVSVLITAVIGSALMAELIAALAERRVRMGRRRAS
nr:MAG: hypothetical protein DIU78_07865 [Pseudomonadota bacterium]